MHKLKEQHKWGSTCGVGIEVGWPCFPVSSLGIQCTHAMLPLPMPGAGVVNLFKCENDCSTATGNKTIQVKCLKQLTEIHWLFLFYLHI